MSSAFCVLGLITLFVLSYRGALGRSCL